MSKKRPLNNDSENLLKGIGERLKKQHDRKPQENNKDSQPEENNQQYIGNGQEEEEIEETSEEKTKTDWDKQEDTYKTTYTVKPGMEDTFDECRKKFRKELRTLLSRQDAIEIGWLLLNKLDDDVFEEVRSNYSPEDDSIQALKSIIEEYY